MLAGIDYFYRINRRPLYPKRVVITGGPGTGKTSIIQELEGAGFHCFHEVIRQLTLEAKKEGQPDTHHTNPLAFVADPYRFNEQLLEGRLQHYGQASEVEKPVVFYDRGLPDILAYMEYFEQGYGPDFETACRQNRYDMVLLLPPWEAIYVSDNERLESFAEAMAIHQQISECYKRFGYAPVFIPEATVKERVEHILQELTREHYL